MMSLYVNSITADSIDEIIDASVSEFNRYVRKSVENVLEMGRIVFEAKQKLEQSGNKDDFGYFCERIGFTNSSSTIKKYLCIGSSYDYLVKAIPNLPNSWTTIYQISQIEPASFTEMVACGEVHSKITGKELRELLVKNISSHTFEHTEENVIESNPNLLNERYSDESFALKEMSVAQPFDLNDFYRELDKYTLKELREVLIIIKKRIKEIEEKKNIKTESRDNLNSHVAGNLTSLAA